MNKKYELTEECKIVGGIKLFRIKALESFSDISKGQMGGFVESENNLSHRDDAWVYDDAKVCGDAQVYGNAQVYGKARVYGDARVYGNAWVCGNARVCGNAQVYGNADYTTIKGFGTCFRTTTFFKCRDETIKVSCGCFLGTLDEFREQVKKTRNGKIAEEYLMIADLMELHFKD